MACFFQFKNPFLLKFPEGNGSRTCMSSAESRDLVPCSPVALQPKNTLPRLHLVELRTSLCFRIYRDGLFE